MSYKNKVITLASILSALILIYAAGLLFSPERRAAMAESGRLLSGKDTEAVSLSIKAPGSPELLFAKEGKTWFLLDGSQKLPVESSRIESFLGEIASVNRLSIRSEGASLAAYGLDEASAVSAIVKSDKGKEIASFSVGRDEAIGKGFYVKLSGKPAVYAVEAGFGGSLKGGRATWLDLRLSASPPKVEDVQAISVDSRFPTDLSGKPAKSFSWVAARKDGGWVLASGGNKALDSGSVESMLRTAINLEASDIVAQPPADAFTPVLCRIELSLGSGKKSVIEVGVSSGEQAYYLRTPDSAYIYTVSAYSIANLLRPEESLSKK